MIGFSFSASLSFYPCFSLFSAVSCHLGTPKQPTKWGYRNMYVCMYGWMYVCMYVPFFSKSLHAWNLSGLVAGDSAICGRLAALILRLRPAGLRFEEFRSPVKRGGLGLRFSNRSGLRPAAIWVCGHKPKFCSHSGIGCDFGAGWSCGRRCGQIDSDLRPRVEGH